MSIELLNQIFELCIIPLIGVLTAYFTAFVKKKTREIADEYNDDKMIKYVNLLSQTITDCVTATNQTYVDSLKGENAFDVDAQKKALEKTYQSVMTVLSEEATKYLTTVYGDLEEYIYTKIESEVKTQKKGA